jgi:hypothetical protein
MPGSSSRTPFTVLVIQFFVNSGFRNSQSIRVNRTVLAAFHFSKLHRRQLQCFFSRDQAPCVEGLESGDLLVLIESHLSRD